MLLSDEKLRQLCIENDWFTYGTNYQYEKLFYANEMGCPIDEIASMIWLCSDGEKLTRDDILTELVVAMQHGDRDKKWDDV